MLDYNYWSFICRLKNYFHGNRYSNAKSQKELYGRIDWFNKYFRIFNNPMALQTESLPDLKRGDVILAELGFNIGMEFGGRHYCIVLKDSKSHNKRVTVLPLTTQKPSDYEYYKDTLYLQFDDINFLHRSIDSRSKNKHKRWCYILNIRTISKSRIIYPNERNLPSETKRISQRHMREISERIISQIALMPDLLSYKKKYKNLKNQYDKLKKEYDELVTK